MTSLVSENRQRCQLHRVAYRRLPSCVVGLDRERARLERVLVLPLRDVRRAVGIRGDQRAVDVEADRREEPLRATGSRHARNDAHRSRETGAAERRRDLNGLRYPRGPLAQPPPDVSAHHDDDLEDEG